MRSNYILFGLITVFMLLTSCSKDVLDIDEAKTDMIKKSKLQNREFVSESLIPNYMDNSAYRQMQIYTPPGYEKHGSETYPVVYLLHGLPFSEKFLIRTDLWEPWVVSPMPFMSAPDFPEEGFREWVDGLIESGTIDPMIIVMPNAAAEGYGFSMYTNSVLNGGYEDYIVNDLVNYIDSHYRTIQSKNGRALIGNSQGGYAAIKLGILHPDVFGVVASHTGLLYLDGVLALSPVIMQENPDGFNGPDPAKFLTSAMYAFSAAWSPNLSNPPFMVDLPFDESGNIIPAVRDKWMMHDVFSMLDQTGYRNNISSLNGVYLDAGIYDELNMKPMSDAIDAKLTAHGIDHTYLSFEGGHFNRIFSRLEISLAFCSDRME